MQTGFFVPGGSEEGFPTDPDYPITDRHTAYEWAMALADVHPYAHWVASVHGSSGELAAETIAGKKARQRAIDNTEQAAGIYRELKGEVKAGRLYPRRTERCIARPGIDPPNEPDFTRYVFGLDQILPLIRRRGDDGQLIGELLARNPLRPAPVQPPAPTLNPQRGPPPVKRLRVETAMRDTIGDDGEKAQALRSVKEEELATKHKVSRDTARRARANVLSEFELRQNSTIDK